MVNEYSWLQKFSELNDASFSRMRASKYIIYLFWVSLIHEIYIKIPQISYDKQGWCVPNVSQFEAVWNICGVVSRLNSKRKQDPGCKEILSYLGRTPIYPIEGEGGKRRVWLNGRPDSWSQHTECLFKLMREVFMKLYLGIVLGKYYLWLPFMKGIWGDFGESLINIIKKVQPHSYKNVRKCNNSV